jgi:hypothetical protein
LGWGVNKNNSGVKFNYLFLFFLIKKETKKSRQNECSAVLPGQRHMTSTQHIKPVK